MLVLRIKKGARGLFVPESDHYYVGCLSYMLIFCPILGPNTNASFLLLYIYAIVRQVRSGSVIVPIHVVRFAYILTLKGRTLHISNKRWLSRLGSGFKDVVLSGGRESAPWFVT